MRDGLYRIVTHYFCAGFVVKEGKIIKQAPILWNKKRMEKYKNKAVWICK